MSKLSAKLLRMAYNSNTHQVTFMLNDGPQYLFQAMSVKQYHNLQKWIVYDKYYEWHYDKKTFRVLEGPYPLDEESCVLL